MRLFIDTDSNSFITDAGFKAPVSGVSFKRGDASQVQLSFVSGNSSLSATNDKQIIFGIKEAGKYDGTFLVSTDDFTTSGTSYILNPSFNTEELNDLLNSGDADDSNDVGSVSTMLEITWSNDDGETWYSTNTITATIENDVIKGNEGTPLESPTPLEWLELYRPSPLSLSAAPISQSSARSQVVSITLSGTCINAGSNSLNISYDSVYLSWEVYSAPGTTVTALASGFRTYAATDGDTITASASAGGSGATITFTIPPAANKDIVIDFTGDATGYTYFNYSNHTITTGLSAITGTPGTLGQDAIVNELDVYKCVRTSPVKWTKLY